MKRLPRLLLFALLVTALLAFPVGAQAVCSNQSQNAVNWGEIYANAGTQASCNANGTCANAGTQASCNANGTCANAGTQASCNANGTCANVGTQGSSTNGTCTIGDCLGATCDTQTVNGDVQNQTTAAGTCGNASRSESFSLNSLFSYLMSCWNQSGTNTAAEKDFTTYYNSFYNISERPTSGSEESQTVGNSLPQSNQNTPVSDYASQVVALVNQERAAAGLPALVMDTQLTAGAAIRAGELSTLFSHTRPDGSSCFTALGQAGASYRQAGENIAIGQQTPQQVVTDWMNSPGHRANILNSAFSRIGVAVVTSSNSAYGGYAWAQFFAD